MGACCLKTKYSTLEDEPQVQEYHETSQDIEAATGNGVNFNYSDVKSSVTDEEREAWIESQWSEPGDENFFSKKINLLDFNIEYLVGTGSFSKVYLVKKKDNEKFYAMKELKKSAMINEKK